MAADKSFNKLVLGGQKLAIKWAHSQAKQQTATTTKTNRSFDAAPQPQLPLPPSTDYFNLSTANVNVMPPGMKLNQLPPSMISNSAYQAMYQNNMAPYPAPYSSIPLPSTLPSASNTDNLHIPPPSIAESLHYPSQDPNRLGAIKK